MVGSLWRCCCCYAVVVIIVVLVGVVVIWEVVRDVVGVFIRVVLLEMLEVCMYGL